MYLMDTYRYYNFNIYICVCKYVYLYCVARVIMACVAKKFVSCFPEIRRRRRRSIVRIMTDISQEYHSLHPAASPASSRPSSYGASGVGNSAHTTDEPSTTIASVTPTYEPVPSTTLPTEETEPHLLHADSKRYSLNSVDSLASVGLEKLHHTHTLTNDDTYPTTPPSFQVIDFLKWAYELGDIVGLQAYRLVTELIHNYLCQTLAVLSNVSIDELELDPTCQLGIIQRVHVYTCVSYIFSLLLCMPYPLHIKLLLLLSYIIIKYIT